MDSPIDYSSAFPSQTPTQSLAQGYQLGAGIRDDMQQQTALQQAQLQQVQQQKALQGLVTNPAAGAQDYSAASLMFPKLREQIDQSWKMKNTAQQESALKDYGQAFAAITSGRPDIAVQQLQAKATAGEQSGTMSPQDVQALRTHAQVIAAHPEFARTQAGLMLAAIPGGDKILSGATTIGTEQRLQNEAPADLAIKNAKAGIETVAANNAPTKTALENANAGEDVLSKQNARKIADLNVQIGQANSETERGKLILDRDKLVAEQGQKLQTKNSAAQDQFDTLQSSIGTVDSLMKHPGLEGWFGAGSISGKQAAMIPGTDAKDFRAQLDTLKSQEFLSKIKEMQGMGALSNAEGDKIGAAIANLDPDQSQKQLINNLGIIRATMQRAQSKLVGSGNLSQASPSFFANVPGVGKVTDGDINRMLAANPGATREQAIQYLQSRAGK